MYANCVVAITLLIAAFPTFHEGIILPAAMTVASLMFSLLGLRNQKHAIREALMRERMQDLLDGIRNNSLTPAQEKLIAEIMGDFRKHMGSVKMNLQA